MQAQNSSGKSSTLHTANNAIKKSESQGPLKKNSTSFMIISETNTVNQWQKGSLTTTWVLAQSKIFLIELQHFETVQN